LKTIEALRKDYAIGVIEVDIDSSVDAEKIASQGIKAVQLRTGGFAISMHPWCPKDWMP
jgi:hydrogenase nickel incorporation protein HypB